ncbi:hypothetical protein E1298_46960, partial [Actinomadura rubrisoli]
MTTRRMFVTAIGAVIPVIVLALLFDNQWVVDAINDSDFEYDEGLGTLVGWLEFPSWRVSGVSGSSRTEWDYVLALDFSTLLFLVLLALLVLAAVRSIDPRRGHFGAVVVGWWATVLAGGLTGIVRGFLAKWTLDIPDGSLDEAIWRSVSGGAGFGLAYGWLAGLGALAGFFTGRPREYAPQQAMQGAYPPPGAYPHPGASLPPGGPMPSGPQMMPQQAHGGQGLPPQHPAAVPYVPPPGAPQQQPAWGAPGPQQPYPGMPVPQQPAPPFPQQPVPQQPFPQQPGG